MPLATRGREPLADPGRGVGPAPFPGRLRGHLRGPRDEAEGPRPRPPAGGGRRPRRAGLRRARRRVAPDAAPVRPGPGGTDCGPSPIRALRPPARGGGGRPDGGLLAGGGGPRAARVRGGPCRSGGRPRAAQDRLLSGAGLRRPVRCLAAEGRVGPAHDDLGPADRPLPLRRGAVVQHPVRPRRVWRQLFFPAGVHYYSRTHKPVVIEPRRSFGGPS